MAVAVRSGGLILVVWSDYGLVYEFGGLICLIWGRISWTPVMVWFRGPILMSFLGRWSGLTAEN